MAYLFTITAEHVRKQRGQLWGSLSPRVVVEAGQACMAMGVLLPGDVGKRVYNVRGVIQVENEQQRAARLA